LSEASFVSTFSAAKTTLAFHIVERAVPQLTEHDPQPQLEQSPAHEQEAQLLLFIRQPIHVQ